MRTSVSVLAIAVVALAGSTAASGKVLLVDRGKSAFEVALMSPQSPAAAFAAEELQRYVQQMTGCRMKRGEADSAHPAVVIGLRADLPTTVASLLPAPAPGYDGYAVAVTPARIVIAGDNGRGVLYGVYDLLERCGCRWFYPQQDRRDCEVVPRTDRIVLDATAWSVASPMRIRVANPGAWFFSGDLVNARLQLDWAAKNRYNALGWQCETRTSIVMQYRKMEAAGLWRELDRRELLLHGPGHSFDRFLDSNTYMKEHPEWFGMRDGKRVPQNFFGAQFCWSNAHARGQFARNVADFVAECPRINILYIVPFDGGRACACPDCAKIGASNALMAVMSAAIDRLPERLRVETVGGYPPVVEPPTAEKMHPRQAILWAHWGRYHGFGYDDPRYTHKTNLLKWKNAAPAGVTVGQYYSDNFAEPWVLPPWCTTIAGDRRFFLAQHIDSVYMLMWAPGYWWNHALNG